MRTPAHLELTLDERALCWGKFVFAGKTLGSTPIATVMYYPLKDNYPYAVTPSYE